MAGRRGRRLLSLLPGNPFLAGLQVVGGRSPGRAGPALPSAKRGGAGCGVTPNTSPVLPAQGAVPRENREKPAQPFSSSLTTGGSSPQSSPWPPAPSPPPVAMGRGGPQHLLTHPQLAWAGEGGCWGQPCPPPAPSRTQDRPAVPEAGGEAEAVVAAGGARRGRGGARRQRGGQPSVQDLGTR